MNTALIAAGALIASTLAAAPAASAGNAGFNLTLGGDKGYVQISSPGKNHEYKKGRKRHGYGQGYGYGPGYGYGQRYGTGYGSGYGTGQRRGYGQRHGYGNPYSGNFNLKHARALGYCMTPREIRRKLRHNGWHGFKVRKIRPAIAIVNSRRHGVRYRLKIDRCTGAVLRAKPRGGYGQYGYY